MLLLAAALLAAAALATASSSSSTDAVSEREYLHPRTARAVAVRRDTHTHLPVQRGLLAHLTASPRFQWLLDAARSGKAPPAPPAARGGDGAKGMGLEAFRRALQCAPREPDIDRSSLWNLLRLGAPCHLHSPATRFPFLIHDRSPAHPRLR